VESIDEIFKIDSNLNIFANFLNEDDDLKNDKSLNIYNAPLQKPVLSKSAFSKTDAKDPYKSINKMDLNLINNSDSNSTIYSNEDFSNEINTKADINHLYNNFNDNINKSNSINQNHKSFNFDFKNHSNFNNNCNNNFPNLSNNSFNFAKEYPKILGFNEVYNNNNNFNRNLFTDKYYNFKGVFNKEINLEKSKYCKTNEEFLNKKTQRENIIFRKETDNSIQDSNLTNISYVNFYFYLNLFFNLKTLEE